MSIPGEPLTRNEAERSTVGSSEEFETRGLHVRCPNCHCPIELVDSSELGNIDCPSCGSNFSLVNDDNATRHALSLKEIAHFKIVERIGSGAFGTVWKAFDTKLDRTVALKVPRRGQLDSAQEEQFLREARSSAQLNHPHIVSVHEVGREGETIFIVSDLIRGVPLAEMIAESRLGQRESIELMTKVADALHHAHERGVIHRDLKPQNVMIDDNGEPHLMDFGLAKRDAGEVTMTLDGAVLGTPAYMSPEQARGESHRVGRTTDVYSLGVMLFQLLTGELPFRGSARMLLHKVINDEAPSLRQYSAHIPRDLETITLKCLEKDPDRRYQTSQEVSDELKRFLACEPIVARPISALEKNWRWAKKNSTVSILASVIVVGSIAAAITFFVRSQEMKVERNKAIAATRKAEEEREKAEQATAKALKQEAIAQKLLAENMRTTAALKTANDRLVMARDEAVAARETAQEKQRQSDRARARAERGRGAIEGMLQDGYRFVENAIEAIKAEDLSTRQWGFQSLGQSILIRLKGIYLYDDSFDLTVASQHADTVGHQLESYLSQAALGKGANSINEKNSLQIDLDLLAIAVNCNALVRQFRRPLSASDVDECISIRKAWESGSTQVKAAKSFGWDFTPEVSMFALPEVASADVLVDLEVDLSDLDLLDEERTNSLFQGYTAKEVRKTRQRLADSFKHYAKRAIEVALQRESLVMQSTLTDPYSDHARLFSELLDDPDYRKWTGNRDEIVNREIARNVKEKINKIATGRRASRTIDINWYPGKLLVNRLLKDSPGNQTDSEQVQPDASTPIPSAD